MMEDTMDQAPDLIGPVVAYRAWRVNGDKLRSMGMPCTWQPGEDVHAACNVLGCGAFYGTHRAPAPEGQGRCGIYVTHTLDDLLAEPTQVADLRRRRWSLAAIAGQVEVWGSSERHARGRRVEWCRVRALYETPLAGLVDVDALAETYGVPVLDDPDGKIGAWREEKPEGADWLTLGGVTNYRPQATGHLFGHTTHVHVQIGAAMQDYVDAINRAIRRFTDATQLPTVVMRDMADAIGQDPTDPDKPIPGHRKDHLQIADRNRTKGARNG